jgi:hypothetical protein
MERRRPRHRHDHAHGRDVDAALLEEVDRPAEDAGIVLVEAEHDPEMDGDAVAMKMRDESSVIDHSVVRLVRRLEALLRDRLQTQEQRLAAAPRRELDELLIARRVGGALARPPFLERNQRREQLLGITRARADVVVPEDDRARRADRDLADHLVDRTVAHRAWSVEERDGAVVAAVGTAPRRDRDRLSVAASFDEVPARRRHPGERRLPRRDVDRLESPAPRIVEDARPRVFRFADDDSVGMARGFLGKSGGVRSADHHRHAAAAELAGECVGVKRGRRRRGDPHQVRRRVEVDRIDDLVGVRNAVLGRRERRHQRHGELRKLNEAGSAKTPRLRRFSGDQMHSHREDGTR